ncbi:class I SAM-dependent methyltransferase [Pedobacter mucosus]|uniref:class I SAM-dependent methyltransferase n=1 Tax=Pedobacter mucosus TaxID=2895286 RepID=UPI001EE438EF|nr:class I SAM-dependent methyltransferase [Pedobacter mucosus]UKT62231.1 class I SAM-dependent methyltransferase [Pedobacter mucosus]
MECRFCKTELKSVFIDLNTSPASNSFLTKEQLNDVETFYPLKVYTCEKCFLVQLDEHKSCDSIFDDKYVYFSSFSNSWLAHAKAYTQTMVDRFKYNEQSQVIEIASNDGYLLQYFKEQNIPVLGIEPTKNTAQVAKEKGIETITEFFGTKLAKQLVAENRLADLLLGNNVLAHVPNIVDFVAGMKMVLKENGVITMEFPHLLQLMENNQFDTIYHEHYSYLSFLTVSKIFEAQGLELFDVEEIQTHGGSLRIFAKHKEDTSKAVSAGVYLLLEKEIDKGMNKIAYYEDFQRQALKIKTDFTFFVREQKSAGKKIAAYGAAAKGNTLLNYCGIGSDDIDFVVDANPYKQNKWLPGSHIPVVGQFVLEQEKPDYLIILPWNLQAEIVEQLQEVKNWGCKFVVAIPFLTVLKDTIEKVLV